MKREIIKIDREKCDGCGLCIPNCPEGALQIIDDKATLVSDLYCDGLGACIGECPKGAIEIEEREAEPYSEKLVMENIVKKGENVIKAHLKHLKEHGESELLAKAIDYLRKHNIDFPDEFKKEKGGNMNKGFTCPGTAAREINKENNQKENTKIKKNFSHLKQWPVQLHLINPEAPYLKNADLLISADCVPYAYGNFHNRFMKDKVVITLCPKLDIGIEDYIEKLSHIFKVQDINSVTVLNMEVPCCSGTIRIVENALKDAKKFVIIKNYTVGINGEIK